MQQECSAAGAMTTTSVFATVLGLSALLFIFHPQAMFSAIDTGRPEYFSLGDNDENLVSCCPPWPFQTTKEHFR